MTNAVGVFAGSLDQSGQRPSFDLGEQLGFACLELANPAVSLVELFDQRLF
ncbi:hypothetical protein [Mycolicibacterium sp. 120270]|uniref:hypothetical protein n=1 Tax=Mycolicibacterium sp. 120270 TaxID=3090600 RepID=UPI00299E17BB|nr:hypothetical protein [Mycolicibacterium sp. 120270]MDX1884739.1 hypothetical protein [Mycolicibacterium sp. 120270]